MQAMLLTSNSLKDKQHSKVQKAFEKKPKKEKAKKADAAANVTISPYALDSKLAVGKAPSADEYQPPSVFLKQMEAPDPKKKNEVMGGVLADLWKL
jgi:hypothetical protein